MEKPWRKLDDSIWETTYARQLRGHIYLGERWKTTEQQQEWETTPPKPHLGDNWETASGKEVEDNETTTRPGANIWETKSRRQLRDHMWEIGQRQLNNNRTGKQQLGTKMGDNWETTSGKEVEDNETTTRPGANIWETKSRRQLRDHMWEIGQRQLNNNRTGKQPLGTTSGRQLGDHIWETSRRQQRDHICKRPGKKSKPPDCETTSETTSGR